MQSIEKLVISRIYGKKRGWAFGQKDFATLGSRSAIDLALHRLAKKKTIRRVIRGIYDYPRYSNLLKQRMNPDIDQVARALARKFGWEIQPSGAVALNILALSTQVPAKYVYHSSGPNRTYSVGKTKISFRNMPTKESRFKHYESAILVQALKSLGMEGVDLHTISSIRKWLKPHLRPKILQDTRTVTSWIYDNIRKICLADPDE